MTNCKKLDIWDDNEFGTEPSMEDFDPEKNATTPTEAHTLLMDLFCEVENPAAVAFPYHDHFLNVKVLENCSVCQAWIKIRTYAKNSKDSAGL